MLEWLSFSSCLYVPALSIPVLAVLYYRYMTEKYDIFKQMGVDGPKPSLCGMGNANILYKKGLYQYYTDLKKEYGIVAGTFSGRLAMLNVYDPDMLKQILVKDFDSFRDHFAPLKLKTYGIRKSLTLVQGEEWRHLRVGMTPAFSSRRLKQMVVHMNRCAGTMNDYLQKKATTGEGIDVRSHMQAFVMDSIAGFGFGIDIDSLGESGREFVKHADLGQKNFYLNSLPIYILMTMPFLFSWLQKIGINVMSFDSVNYFSNIVDKVIENRKEQRDTSTSDLIQLLVNSETEDQDVDLMDANDNAREFMNENKGKQKGFSHEEVVGTALTFFLAGNDTSTRTMTFLCYNLTTNPEKQEILISEIHDVMQGHGDPTYDLVAKMKYLEMCLEETLRMFPPLMRTDRMCTKTTVVNGITIPKDLMVVIPIWAIHHDPEIYPEPERFIPERFNSEGKASRSPYAWLPFGAGPRMCVGQRLAIMEMKIAMVHLLTKFRLVTCEETPKTLSFHPFSLFMAPEDKIVIKIEKR